METIEYHIHGDNIVECERTLDLIAESLKKTPKGPFGLPSCPTFEILTESKIFKFVYYPGYGRWDKNILDFFSIRGGVLRESPDALVTRIVNGNEEPIIAIEYSGSLSAGNQAWQRHGRAYSIPKTKIPYLYIAELGGFELNQNREKKAARDPNPAVPFSYFKYLAEGFDIMPIYTPNPGIENHDKKAFEQVFGMDICLKILGDIFTGVEKVSIESYADESKLKTLKLVEILVGRKKRASSLSQTQWAELGKLVGSSQSYIEYITKLGIPWRKKVNTGSKYSESFIRLLNIAAEYAIGIASNDLPMCLIPRVNRQIFASNVLLLYPSLSTSFQEWLKQDQDLIVCWVNGFKPQGDDSRPDRGLPAFTRMLVGSEIQMLTVVFGPAKETVWEELAVNPFNLMNKNGLWESVLGLSDALLVDSKLTNKTTIAAYKKSHWQSGTQLPKAQLLGMVAPQPNFGEDDVDTVLHLIFRYFGKPHVFEGMCNPPGGDWSGISLQNPLKSIEYRWLSLPRVSGENAKRPDHIFQIFDLLEKPIVLIVESKDMLSHIEMQIGPRLITYVNNLITKSSANAQRSGRGDWSTSRYQFQTTDLIYASAVACLFKKESEVEGALSKAGTDLAIGVRFSDQIAEIVLRSSTSIGEQIINFLNNKLDKTPVFRVLQ